MTDVPEDFGTSSEVITTASNIDGAAAAYAEAVIAAFDAIKNGPLQVLDSQLAALYLNQSQSNTLLASFAATMQSLPEAIDTSAGYVTIDAIAKDHDGAALLAELGAIGLVEGGSFGSMASGLLPISQVSKLVQLSDLSFARQSGYLSSAGLAMNQGDHAMLADLARASYGVDGSGIKIGILSDSFNNLGGMSADVASGDLPAATTILEDLPSSGSDEGRAMAQLAHDIAPGAAIAFATAFTGIANFANNILALAASGARVIVDDIIYYAETAYQDGPIAQAIDQVTANGVAYFSAAGNDGHKGFEASFVDSGVVGSFGESLAKLTTGGSPQFLPITVPRGKTVTIVLEWNQPAASVSGGAGSQSDVDLFVYNSAGTNIPFQSITGNIGGDPVEIVQFTAPANGPTSVTYNLAVGLYAGPAPTDFKLMALDNGAGVTLGSSSLNTNTGAIYGHAAATGAIAVGAAYYQQTPAYGASPPVVENYSSYGPTRILFDTAGNALASADIRLGPDIVAPDGGDTTFFGFDSDSNGKPNFFGTSAAAPDAAAVAALMLQADGALNPSDIRNLLADSAIDMNDPATAGFDTGFDNATGYGLIQANKAVQYAATHIIALDSTHGAIFGTHLNDVFTGGAGNHSIAGGNGADALDYGSASAAVNVSLASGSGSNGFGGTDTFSGIEKLIGSSNGDVLSGGSSNDTLAGGAGADCLTGGGADDVLIGGAGNDSLDGAMGVDTATYSGLWANYLIVKSGATSFSITDNRAGTPDGADTILNVETLSFTDVLAISAGAAVTPAIVSFANDGGIAGDFLTNDSDLLLSGNAGASGLVTIFDGGVSLGTASAGLGGAWIFQTGVLGSGVHSFTAAATDGSNHWGALSSAFSVTLDLTADAGGAASLVVNDTADHVIDRTEAASVQFTIAGLDSDATGVASFTDGTHIVQVGGITANGAYAANLTSLDGATIHTSLAISDVAGNQATIAGNDVLLASVINEPPTAFADTATALEAGGASNGTPGVDPAGNVLVNDTDPNSGDTKTVQGVAAGTQSGPLSSGVGASIAGAYGTLLLNANGSYAYTLDNTKPAVQALNTGAHLSDVFTYTMHDTAGAFSTATLTVTINGADDAPSQPQDIDLNINSVTENAANGTAVGITASATDIDGGSLTYSLADNAGGRFAIDPVSGVVTIANGALLDFDTAPAHTIIVQVSDGVLTSSQNFMVALTNVGGVTITGKSTGDIIDGSHTVAGQPLPTGEEDNINGASGADSINALGGNDTINGGSGGDTMAGAAGDDLYIADNTNDLLIENPGEGTDSVQASVNFVLGINFENLTLTGAGNLAGTGNAAANVITGNSGNNLLAGLGGADTLDGDAGIDTATYALSSGAVTVSLSGGTGTGGDAQGDVLSNVENLTGSAFGDCLQGNGAGNSLIGNDGDDTLDGGAGADSMVGGLGNDTYLVDAFDVVTESSNQGIDTVITAVNYTLPSNVENLTFSAAGAFVGSGNSNPNMIVGGGANDNLSGLSGNDTLDGGVGADTMAGGANDDTYLVDNSGDQIVEASGGGTDTILFVISSATLLANVENLTFEGTGDCTETGNLLANILIGGDGNDSLSASDGNDTLDGSEGADSMAGGIGNDLYKVDNSGDQVIEVSGGGTDTVLVGLNNYVLAANVENLSFVGAGNFTAAGNILANAITGGVGDDALNGSDGNDTLDGGAGDDSLTGGLGNDTFIVDSAGDVATEAAASGTDAVKTTLTSYTLAANVEALTSTGASDFSGTGNDLANTLTGGNGHDTLDGGVGNDKVLGGLGDDQLLGGSGNDSLTGGAGADTATGGAGADRFTFTAVSEFASGATLDSLADFTHAQSDKIDLSGIDADAISAGNQAFTFIGPAGFSSHAGQLGYVVNGADVIVSGDTDGNGVSDFSFKVVGVSSLVTGDFIL